MESVEAYKGNLSLKEIVRGFHLCTQNAEQLLEEAQFLIERNCYARAYTLIVISEEEIAKCMMLATAATLEKNNKKAWRRFWKRFRSHTAKQQNIIFLDQALCKSVTKKDLLVELKFPLERIKQLGLYVDNIDGKFTLPNDFFARSKAKQLVKTDLKLARNRLRTMKALHERVKVKILKKMRKSIKKQAKDGKRVTLREIVEGYKRMGLL